MTEYLAFGGPLDGQMVDVPKHRVLRHKVSTGNGTVEYSLIKFGAKGEGWQWTERCLVTNDYPKVEILKMLNAIIGMTRLR